MNNVGGVFLVLLVGCVSALLIGAVEFWLNVYAVAKNRKVDSFGIECVFIFSIKLHYFLGNKMGSF